MSVPFNYAFSDGEDTLLLANQPRQKVARVR